MQENTIGEMTYQSNLAPLSSSHLWSCPPPSPFYQKQRVLQQIWSTTKKEPYYLQKIYPTSITPLHSNIEEQNDTYTFKKFTSQPYSLDFVEAASKEIGAHKINKH